MEQSQILTALEKLNTAAKLKGIKQSFIICGGASLILQGVVGRSTKDIDIIEPTIPQELIQDIEIIAKELGINSHWFNCGPSSIVKDLDSNWKKRIVPVFNGSHIEIFSISREDLIFSKLWAMCDRQQDEEDLIALSPTINELSDAAKKVANCDGNTKWPEWVSVNVKQISKRLGYE